MISLLALNKLSVPYSRLFTKNIQLSKKTMIQTCTKYTISFEISVHVYEDQQTIYKYCPLWLDRNNNKNNIYKIVKLAVFGLSNGLWIPLNKDATLFRHD